MEMQSIQFPTKSFALLSASLFMSSHASAAVIFSDSFESPDTTVTGTGVVLVASLICYTTPLNS